MGRTRRSIKTKLLTWAKVKLHTKQERRPVTPPLPESTGNERQLTSNQRQSSFFKLPLEVHQIIYGLYFDYDGENKGDLLERGGTRGKVHSFPSLIGRSFPMAVV
jgi:hypothetical protein